jgi:photosystem II stability/assembly factor-like uncharacterized protein
MIMRCTKNKSLDENKMKNVKRYLSIMAALCCLVGFGFAAVAQESESVVEVLESGIPHDRLFSIEFRGSWGLAVGSYGLMLETQDGGESWTTVNPLTNKALLGVSAVEGTQIVVGQQGTIIRRADGSEWEQVDAGLTQRLMNVDINDSGLAFVVGEFGFMGKSDDAGLTWSSVAIDWEKFNDEGYEPHLYNTVVKNDGTIFVVGEFGLILRSVDGGQSFTAVHRGDQGVFDVHFAKDGTSNGYAVGQEGLVLRTSDGGLTWSSITVDTNSNLLGVWSGNGEIVITGIRELLRSSDDGKSFTSFSSDGQIGRTWYQGVGAGVSETATGVEGWLREQQVFIVGNGGNIAKVLY